ncbi:carboxylic ester hydrolase-like [Penaeus indicus]|uniref:carboxylic ester hydrolase-like n=1 Tax=Penaeus indicus TaxID=29960 RepID=UPI00300D941D
MLAEALLVALALQLTVEGGIVQWQYYGENPQVRLKQGKLQGRRYQSLKGANYHSFVGIPYARPPVGSLRLQDPVAADEWEGVRDAVECPPRCPQVVGTEIVGSEDCLYLSVFTPEAKSTPTEQCSGNRKKTNSNNTSLNGTSDVALAATLPNTRQQHSISYSQQEVV